MTLAEKLAEIISHFRPILKTALEVHAGAYGTPGWYTTKVGGKFEDSPPRTILNDAVRKVTEV